MLTKTNLSPSLIVISSCLHSSITFFLNVVAFSVLFLISGKAITISAILFIPIFILFFLLTTSIAHILIILSSRFTDFKHIWEIILQVGFWATPIVYTIERAPENIQKIIMTNPIARIIDLSRDAILLPSNVSFQSLGILTIFVIIVGIIAILVYKKNKFMVVDQL